MFLQDHSHSHCRECTVLKIHQSCFFLLQKKIILETENVPHMNSQENLGKPRARTNNLRNGCYQVHYLPASLKLHSL